MSRQHWRLNNADRWPGYSIRSFCDESRDYLDIAGRTDTTRFVGVDAEVHAPTRWTVTLMVGLSGPGLSIARPYPRALPLPGFFELSWGVERATGGMQISALPVDPSGVFTELGAQQGTPGIFTIELAARNVTAAWVPTGNSPSDYRVLMSACADVPLSVIDPGLRRTEPPQLAAPTRPGYGLGEAPIGDREWMGYDDG